MKPYYADEWLTIYEGDCRTVLAELPADSVDCVVTSPPYWGLRDYGTATWVGGDEACDHQPPDEAGGTSKPTAGQRQHAGRFTGPKCWKCGATRQDSQLGLERTPEEYVANMVAVFAEVRRVLKPSGTCWLNLGDSYASDMKGSGGSGTKSGLGLGADGSVRRTEGSTERWVDRSRFTTTRMQHGLKPKDLVGIPWRVAFALQADGWYLRSDVIWSKPNPMPESVTDRPTKAHEYLFLLTKSARYYFDADAVRESVAEATFDRLAQNVAEQNGSTRQPGKTNGPMRAVGTTAGRNIRSVWIIATRPYPGAHFAVFPPELPERCIKAGSSEWGVCPECGAPWERVVERTSMEVRPTKKRTEWQATDDHARTQLGGMMVAPAQSTFVDWMPKCFCAGVATYDDEIPPIPAVILDPFAGSGTVGLVANRLSRRAILIDLNPEYLRQQMKRNAQTPLGLGAA